MMGAGWRGSLSSGQLFWLMFVLMFPTLVFFPPGDLIRDGGRWAWLTPLVAAVPACLLCSWVGRRAGKHGDWVAVARKGLGPVAAPAALALTWLPVAAYAVVIHREFADIASATYVLAMVPKAALLMIGIVVTMYVAWLGPIVMARAASLLGPMVVVVFLASIVLWLPSVRLVFVRPFLPANLDFLNADGLLLMTTWLIEPILGALLIHRASGPARQRAGRTFVAAAALAAVLTSVTTWVVVAVVSVQHGSTLSTPFITMLQAIQSGFFPLHLETVVVPVDLMAGTMKTGLFVWFMARLARGVAPLPFAWLIAGSALLSTVVAGMAFSTPIQTDAALKQVLGPWAMPALVATCVLTYATFRRRVAA